MVLSNVFCTKLTILGWLKFGGKREKSPKLTIKPLKIIHREPKFCHRDEVIPQGEITQFDIEFVKEFIKKQVKARANSSDENSRPWMMGGCSNSTK